MNGPHDLGGQMGFGPVNPEYNEPVFHAPWEGRLFAMKMASSWVENLPIDASRHQHENLHPAKYLNSSYYQIWLASLEASLVRLGLVSKQELVSGHSINTPSTKFDILLVDDVSSIVSTPQSYKRSAQEAAKFSVGDRVKTRNMHPIGHTRLPRYARGHLGTVQCVNGCMVFPDSNAHGLGENPQWCYNVCFSGHELWGPDADPAISVSLDLWEPYLEAS